MKSWGGGGGGVSIAIVAIHAQGAKHTQIKHALLLGGLGSYFFEAINIKR